MWFEFLILVAMMIVALFIVLYPICLGIGKLYDEGFLTPKDYCLMWYEIISAPIKKIKKLLDKR